MGFICTWRSVAGWVWVWFGVPGEYLRYSVRDGQVRQVDIDWVLGIFGVSTDLASDKNTRAETRKDTTSIPLHHSPPVPVSGRKIQQPSLTGNDAADDKQHRTNFACLTYDQDTHTHRTTSSHPPNISSHPIPSHSMGFTTPQAPLPLPIRELSQPTNQPTNQPNRPASHTHPRVCNIRPPVSIHQILSPSRPPSLFDQSTSQADTRGKSTTGKGAPLPSPSPAHFHMLSREEGQQQ
ncbi:hypothetical protein VTJ04DRAFT_8217 [Mycothermus thermophilus]|uniref:uncharacterized protein n=1 Tax=Humicola insolens TaxID=85995 RepID=UPI003742FF3F